MALRRISHGSYSHEAVDADRGVRIWQPWQELANGGPDLWDAWGNIFNYPVAYERGPLHTHATAFLARARHIVEGRIRGARPYACALPRDRTLRTLRTAFRRAYGREPGDTDTAELLDDLRTGLALILCPDPDYAQGGEPPDLRLGFILFDAEGPAPPFRRPRQQMSVRRSAELMKLVGHAADALATFPVVWEAPHRPTAPPRAG